MGCNFENSWGFTVTVGDWAIAATQGSTVCVPPDLRAFRSRRKFAWCVQEYLVGFKHTAAVMKRAAALERIAYEFGIDSFADNVRYVEVRFAPQLHAGMGRSVTKISQTRK